MSSHRRYWRKRPRRPADSSSSATRSTSYSSMQASTTQTADDDNAADGHRRRSPASKPSWVLLNRAGARRDGFTGDHRAAMAYTSRGEKISVSFVLVEPPGTSVLTVDWPRASTTQRKSKPSVNVIAAHRDVVLLAITDPSYSSYSFIDLFVYQASRDRDHYSDQHRQPSLLLLPYAGRPVVHSHRMGATQEFGIMSCTSNDDVDDGSPSPPSFLVAGQLRLTQWGCSVRVFRSGSGQWESFENLGVRGASRCDDVDCWSTDAVVPYGRRYMIWVDYYRGMVIMDLSLQSHSETTTTNPPLLRYVPLPVDRVGEDNLFGNRGDPKASRRVCVTRHGIKFVSVDTMHCSNFGVGDRDILRWNRRFRITTWWLREDDDGCTWRWRKDLTMHQEEFWDAFDGGDRFPFPHVQPRFPVIDVDSPDVVVFRLEKRPLNPDETKWMIEVDLRKKVLLAAICYSKESDDGDEEAINYARVSHYDPILSELPRYMDGGQACKKGTLMTTVAARTRSSEQSSWRLISWCWQVLGICATYCLPRSLLSRISCFR